MVRARGDRIGDCGCRASRRKSLPVAGRRSPVAGRRSPVARIIALGLANCQLLIAGGRLRRPTFANCQSRRARRARPLVYPLPSAGLAQLVEHLSCKEDVAGSIPAPGSQEEAPGSQEEAPGIRHQASGIRHQPEQCSRVGVPRRKRERRANRSLPIAHCPSPIAHRQSREAAAGGRPIPSPAPPRKRPAPPLLMR